MGNNVTVIPKKPARQSLLTSTENIVYMPLASKNSHGIVKVGDGLDVSVDGLLSVDFTSGWFADTQNEINNVINNITKIGDVKGNFSTKGTVVGENSENSVVIGTGASASLSGSVAILGKADDFGPVAIGSGSEAKDYGVAIGADSKSSSFKSAALGAMAKATADFAVQLGQGTNNEARTLKFRNFTIVDKDGKLKTNTGTSSAPVMEEVAIKSAVDKNTEDIALKANVSELQNYYTKNETYNKQEINKLIVPTQGLRKERVDVLPEIGEDNVLYMVPKTDASGTDYYDEFLWIVDKFELVGSTQTKLEGYVTIEDFDKLVNDVSSAEFYKTLQINGYNASYGRVASGAISTTSGSDSNVHYNPVTGKAGYTKFVTEENIRGLVTTLNNKFTAEKPSIDFAESERVKSETDGAIVHQTELEDALANAGGTNVVKVEEDTITTNKLEKVVHLSEEQYQELITNGSIAIGEQTLTYDENTIYVTNDNASPLKELTLSGTSVLTSTETFNKHIQIMVEFETDSIHAGFDCVLHPYDEAVCFVTYDVLVNGQANFGTAYLDESGHVVINVPSGLTFSNVHAKYCELNAHSGGSDESGASAKKYLHKVVCKLNSDTEFSCDIISTVETSYNTLKALANDMYALYSNSKILANGYVKINNLHSPIININAVDNNSININYIYYSLTKSDTNTLVNISSAVGYSSFSNARAVTDVVVEV